MIKTLSVIIPVFNEEGTIYQVLKKVCNTQLIGNIQKQIIIVDDTSKDNSLLRINEFIDKYKNVFNLSLISHKINLGKGAAVRSGLTKANGELTIIQDADLELNPEDFNVLIAEVVNNNADVVFGSRFLRKQQNAIPLKTKWANGLLTYATRLTTVKHLTDMETCYKLIKTPLFKSFELKENRFGFEPEITVKLLRNKKVIFAEVPIDYRARTVEQGKKIGIQDGFRALFCLIRYRFFS